MALGARAAAADLGASQSAAESNRTILREAGLLAPDQPIASFRVPGDPAREEILSGDFYRLLIREYGQDILAQQLQDTLIRQEAARRGLVVSDADVEAKVALARSQLLQQGEAEGPRQTLEALLAQKNMTLDEFKQELRNQIALETMIRQDFRIPGDVILQDAAINKWVEDVRRRAALRGPREGLPPGIVAVVNGEEILEAGIVKELAERISRSELEKTLDETLNDRIIERLMKEKKIKIKDEDLDAATKRAEEALHKKPGMASITLESYLQAGGKTLNDLRQQFRHENG
jgi:parvulin-like peptidyl-prolyl isomerase